ncbi:centrosomal protein 43 isoform X2 [Pleurodeles waltl]|uniref:centrosomal protein 43 isoform X2 n=1 Tax=Pleurodeles waltl TaxID=8319 RepID=UPI00370977BD
MSAAEEDTELRDLLVQTLESSGVLNKIKAELRAAVFLALEEQEKVENKAPLVNESLKTFLNTKDGRLVSSLVTEYLQFFNLDFTLAVFQPETNTLNDTQDRQNLARDLGIVEGEAARGAPLLLELVKQCSQKDKGSSVEELSPKQITEAKKKFEFYDKDKSGEISKDELRTLFLDLFPHFHRNMLERYVNDEFKAADKDFNNGIDFQEFIGMYRRLFLHCRSVVTQDTADLAPSPWRFTDGKPSIHSAPSTHSGTSKIPRYKGLHKHAGSSKKAGEQTPDDTSKNTNSVRESKSKSSSNSSASESKPNAKLNNLQQASERSEIGVDGEDHEGDSFFDDSVPTPDKNYSWGKDSSKPAGGFTDLTDAPPLKGGLSSLMGAPLMKEPDKASKNRSPRDMRAVTSKVGSLELGNGEEEDYMDDFNSTSHRSDKSEFSIGEEIEEDFSVEIEDFNASDNLDDVTQDHSISHVSVRADYLEDVA